MNVDQGALVAVSACFGAGPYEVFNIGSTNSVSIARSGSDLFSTGGTSITLTPLNSGYKIRCITAGTWHRQTNDL